MAKYNTPGSKPVSPAQIKCLYGLARKASIDNDDLHAMVYEATKLDSIRALTSVQAAQIIDRMKRLLGQEPSAGRPGRASDNQLGMIRAIATNMGWDDDRLRKFCEARFHVSHLNFLTVEDARKITEALKAMQRGGRGERKVRDGTAASLDG